MADQSDVESALVSRIAAALYPNGTGQASSVGAKVRIYPGWPGTVQLDGDLAAGNVHVTVSPESGVEKDATRSMGGWVPVGTTTPPTIAATVTAQDQVTFGGAGAAGVTQYIGLVVGQKGYALGVGPTDTPTSVAAGLAALVVLDFPGTSSSGGVLTIPGGGRLIARVGSTGRLLKEVRRIQKGFQVIVWANSPGLRSIVAKAVDLSLADPVRICLPDGTGGIITYRMSNNIDYTQKDKLYRRDLHYWVEYGVYIEDVAYQVTLPQTAIGPAAVDPVTITS